MANNTKRNKLIHILNVTLLILFSFQNVILAKDEVPLPIPIKIKPSKKTTSPDISVDPEIVLQNQKTVNSAEPVTILDSFIDEAKKQTDQLYTILSGLSAMINDNQVQGIRDKKEVLNNIKAMNYLLQNIQREKFVNSDGSTVYFLLKLNDAFITHLFAAVKTGFTTVKPFDPAPLVKRSFSHKVTPHDIKYLLEKNKRQLALLTKETDKAGLRWYNKAYRVFDKKIVDPFAQYNVLPRFAMTSAVLASSTYIWWRFGNKSFKKTCPTFIHDKFFGEPPKTNKLGYIENENELKLLGRIEYTLAELGHGFLPIGAGITFFAINALKREWGDDENGLKAWLKKKISIVTNKLKGGAYLKKAQKAAEIIDEVTFNDLVGLEQIKEAFQLLVNYLENPESYDRLGLTPPKGILLVGETRTGKSYSVKALFGEIKRMLKRHNRKDEFKFIELNASEINQHGIQKLLNLIKHCAPCIVFIDEIDLLDLQRKGQNQRLSELLTCMSGTLDSKDPKNQVIIIGATNMPENLDWALRQFGRFGQEHRFEYPTFADRRAFLLRKLEKLSLNPEYFNIDKLARETEGKSYEALNILINNALLKARIHGQMLTQEFIEATLDGELRHIILGETKDIPEYQNRMLASHFAGHALVLTLSNIQTKLSKVTIKQVMTDIKEELMGIHLFQGKKHHEDDKQKRFEYGNVFTHHEHDVIPNLHTYEETIALCKFHLAGIAAEKLLLGSCSYSCHKEDKNRALTLAQSIAFEGLDVTRLSKEEQKQRQAAALKILEQCEQEVTQMLQTNRDLLATIADDLYEKKTLTSESVQEIVQQRTSTNTKQPLHNTPPLIAAAA